MTITVRNINDLPTVVDDAFTIDEDSSNNPINPLTNDSDIDGDPLTALTIGLPTQGTARLDGDTVIYTPTLGITGRDSFTYTVDDGFGFSEGLIRVQINNTPDAPIAIGDEVRVTEDRVDVRIPVLNNDRDDDGDALTVLNVGNASNGTAKLDADGSAVLYTPNPNYVGEDSFTYIISDGALQDETTVNIMVVRGNKRPTAFVDNAIVDQDSRDNPLTVLGNDRDSEGHQLTITQVDAPTVQGATVQVNPVNSALLYTPAPGFTGEDRLAYTISDGELTARAEVIVAVQAVNNEADLALRRTDNVTTLFANEEQGVTSIFLITNNGPARATNVTLNADMGTAISGLLGEDANCTSSDTVVTCAIAPLSAGETTTVTLHTLLASPVDKGSVTAEAKVTSPIPDPDASDNGADQSFAVAAVRERRQMGNLTVIADSFSNQNGGTQAQGNIRIGDHFTLSGDDAVFAVDDASAFNGTGTLYLTLGDIAFFSGDFTANGLGIGAPAANATSALRTIGGFAVSAPTIGGFNISSGEVTLRATLALAKDDLNAAPVVDLTVTPGPHIRGTTASPFVVNYGNGEVLRLHSLTGDLVRQGSDYRLRATGVISYNLFTIPYTGTLTLTDTAPYRGEVANVQVALDPDGTVVEQNESLPSLSLPVDYLTLHMEPLTIDNQGLLATVATWQLPAVSGGGERAIQNVRLGVGGLGLVNQVVDLPDMHPENGVFVVRNAKGTLLETPTGYILDDLIGDLTLDLPGNSYTMENMEVTPPSAQQIATAEKSEVLAATVNSPSADDAIARGDDDIFLYAPMDRRIDDRNGAWQWRYFSQGFHVPGGRVGSARGGSIVYQAKKNGIFGSKQHFLNPTKSFSILVWTKGTFSLQTRHDDKPSAFYIQPIGSGSSKSYKMYAHNEQRQERNVLTARMQRADSSQWTHWAFTYDGSTRRIYRNGTQIASANGGPLQDIDWDASGRIEINGEVDELYIYRKALNNSEIRGGNAANSALTVQIGGAALSLNNPKPSGGSIQVDSFSIKLPDILGGRTVDVNRSMTIRSYEQTIPGWPGDLTFGGVPLGSVSAKIKNTSSGYVLTIQGKMLLSLPSKAGDTRKLTVDVELILDSSNKVTGKVNDFTFNLAGFETGVKKAVIDDTKIKVGQASLSPPAILSRMGQATIYDLVIKPPDDLKIGGGSFKIWSPRYWQIDARRHERHAQKIER